MASSLFFLTACIVSVFADDASIRALQQQFLRHKIARRHLVSVPGSSVHVTNRVYLGNDKTKACGSSAVEALEGNVGDDIIYCFKVTNDGRSFLNGISLANPSLEYTDTFDGILAPGKSVEFTMATSIRSTTSMDTQVNRVDVTANPVSADGTDLNVDDVTYMDESSVSILSPYTSPEAVKPKSCLEDSWRDARPDVESLVCSTQDVYFMPNSISSSPASCVAGETIRVNVNALMAITKTVYDLGWYVAADGGDALTGTCTVNAFRRGLDYASMNSLGMVSFEEESIVLGKPDDQCGDVAVWGEDGSGYEMEVPLGSITMKCADENEDGALDMRICFTWRSEETDENCTGKSSDPETVGLLPDLYPGASTGSCFCTSYEIPTVTVTKDKACK